jgi:hypothetical protein
MKLPPLGLLSIWLVVAGAASSARAMEAPNAVRDELLRTTQALVDAIPRGDKSVWERTLADDAVIVDEFGRVSHKADAIAAMRPFPAGFSGSIELRDAHLRQYGDTAVLQVEEYERETVFGQPFVVRYQSLHTFVRQGGAWKLAAWQESTLPTRPPDLAVSGLALADYEGTYRYAPDRAWSVRSESGALLYTTRPGGGPHALQPVAKDVFMSDDDERNLLIFRRDAHGKVDALIQRRKFNDLRLTRDD